MKHGIFAAALAVVMLAGGTARGAESPAPCAGVQDVKSKSRQLTDGQALMTSLILLEKQGEAKFHPTYSPPVGECLFEKFEVAGTSVEAAYAPFVKDEHTLHWRFRSAGTEPREVLVIYDGTSSLMVNKEVFFVIEERSANIHYYAMFREQPNFAALKPMITGILDGSVTPLATVRWPPGAKEPVIDAIDNKRVKL